jgi:hypothetical protein
MKKVSWILFLLAFAIGAVFFACSSPGAVKCSEDATEPCLENSSNSGGGSDRSSDNSGNSGDYSSSSANSPDDYSSDSSNPSDYSSNSNDRYSSSSSLGNSNPVSSSSSITSSLSSSSSVAGTSSSVVVVSSSSVSTTPTCAYQTAWCGGAAFSNVKTASLNSATGSGICTFATAAAMLGNFNNATVNGQKIEKCGNSGWGQQPCTTVLGSVAKADGGYYIYASDYYADFTTTGGTPNCNGNGNNPTPGVSSSAGTNISSSSSNSSGGSTSSNSNGNGTPSYTPTAPGNESGETTQYWDACKPSCSWSTNAGGKPANACNITGGNIGHNDSDRSACDGGTAFTCMNQAPWKVGNVSFGFVAVNDGKCGDCYQLDFPNGEVMVVMKTNIGGIRGKFDIMIPGGGVGDFDALTRQVQQSGVSNPNMGERYGGFRGACGWQGPGVVDCVRRKCDEVFKNLPDLKAGCLWYVNTLGTNDASFNNPRVKYKQVTCPSELTGKY